MPYVGEIYIQDYQRGVMSVSPYRETPSGILIPSSKQCSTGVRAVIVPVQENASRLPSGEIELPSPAMTMCIAGETDPHREISHCESREQLPSYTQSLIEKIVRRLGGGAVNVMVDINPNVNSADTSAIKAGIEAAFHEPEIKSHPGDSSKNDLKTGMYL